MQPRKKIRYYEAEGIGFPAEEGDVWRRLGATADSKGDSRVEDGLLIPETFDALNLAKVELQSLKDLFGKLETQQGLGVTYIPDTRSSDEFQLSQRHEKLIKAEEKRLQMKQASDVLSKIHTKLIVQTQNERTFYRELMGLAHYHKVRCEPTALSPFCVDLSLTNGPTSSPLIVELQADGNGHVMLSEEVPQDTTSEVILMLKQVESNHEQIIQDLNATEEMRVGLLEHYKQINDPGKLQTAPMNRSDQSKKRVRTPEKPASLSRPTLEESKSMEDSEKTLILQKVMSLEFDPEDEELLVAEEESENDEEFDNLSAIPSTDEDLKERWFTKEELIEVMRVHMALNALQAQNVWKLCKKTLNTQASTSSLQPKQRMHFIKAMDLMEFTNDNFFGSVLKADVLSFFVNSVYRLPPFLNKVDIRDLKLSHSEKSMLLTRSSLEGNLEPSLVQEGSSTKEGVEEWLKELDPKEFFELKYKHTAPDLADLLSHFLGLLNHEESLKKIVLEALKSIPGAVVQFDRAPGIHASKLWVELPMRFRGWIIVDGKQLQIVGTKLKSSQNSFVSEKLQSNQFHSWLSDVTP
eukprot:g1289.t1